MQILKPGKSHIGSPTALTIGKFDGVHVGHRVLLLRTRSLGHEMGGPTVVVTFDRHPQEVLQPALAPPYLTPLEDRLQLLEQAGIDYCILLSLEEHILNWPAERFVQEIILNTAQARHVVTGTDFRYGRNREGNVETLRMAGSHAGFTVDIVPPVKVHGHRVSSFAVRAAVQAGDLPLAEAMLGRPFSVSGLIARGRQLGRTLGYPTANVEYDPRVALPALGVYAVSADWGMGDRPAVANLGVRPTVETASAPVWLEVHVLDWSGDLYGKRVKVSFRKRIRDERQFDSLDALKEQLSRDAIMARRVI